MDSTIVVSGTLLIASALRDLWLEAGAGVVERLGVRRCRFFLGDVDGVLGGMPPLSEGLFMSRLSFRLLRKLASLPLGIVEVSAEGPVSSGGISGVSFCEKELYVVGLGGGLRRNSFS